MATAIAERRQYPRARLSFPVRARPSFPTDNDFDEVIATVNSSRRGCYFTTGNVRYKKHMRLFVTLPHSAAHGAINRDYLGVVLRLDELKNGRKGVAVNLLMTVGLTF